MGISSDMQPTISEVRRQFDEDAKRVVSVSKSTLLKILAHNKDTEYGKKNGFAAITDIKQFKEIHPLTKYEHYEPYIKRMLNGEENILAANPVIFFARTSGTTSMGSQKIIPNTNYRGDFRWNLLSQGAIHQSFPATADFHQGVLVVNANGQEYKTQSGVRVGGAETAQLPQVVKIKPYPFTSPPDVFALTDVRSAIYLHAFYGLKNPNILFITTTFVTALLNFFRCIEQHWQQIVKDIRLGTLSNENFVIEQEVKQCLLQHLQPDSERANQLLHIFQEGFEGIAPRLWRNLQYTKCLAGGTFSIYVDKCQRALGDVPIYSRAHGASEGLIGLNLWPGEHIARFVPVPQERYTEFIPVAQIKSANPTTLELTELKEGESYEVVMTSFDGLYRYRLDDIIKVVGHYYELPIYELEGRAGTLLDISGERTTEEMTCWSINEAVRRKSCTLVDYTTLVDLDCSPPRYIFFVELEESSKLSLTITSELEVALSEELDRCLKTVNPIYELERTDGTIAAPRVLLVKKDTFRTATAMLVETGVSELRVKIPRYARMEKLVRLLQENSF